jgi:hypothetical protein
VFHEYEKDSVVKDVVDNLLEYFQWCRETRNQLLHMEHYPSLFGGDELLHLTKREGKQKPKPVYATMALSHLRDIADKIQEGRQQCAKVRIHLRVRGKHSDELEHGLLAYMHQPLPEKLTAPKPLRLRPYPPSVPRPSHLGGRRRRFTPL